MDINFADLKKEAAATAENIYNEAADKTKQTTFDLLSEAGQQDDNAHTEQFFANDQKDLDFEHVDPQAFVQRMSAGAKEAQEQLDAKFSKPLEQEIDNIFALAVNTAYQRKQESSEAANIHDVTRDFMNAERGFAPEPPKNFSPNFMDSNVNTTSAVPEDNNKLLDLQQNEPSAFAETVTAPSQPSQVPQQEQIKQSSHFYDDYFSGLPSSAANKFNKDSDTESSSISYTPSPAKSMSAALKEQDNDKFISSEDLLVDIKDESSSNAEFPKASSSTASSSGAFKNVPTTDLDEDDEDQHAFAMPEAKTSKPLIDTVKKPLPSFSAQPETFEEFKMPSKDEQPKPSTSKAAASVNSPSSVNEPKLLSVEQLFYKYGLDAWFKPERLHPRVESLIYWRDVKKSGIVFGAGVTTILAISCFSVISVIAWLSLILLVGAFAFRVYKYIMQALQKTSDGHPFEEFLKFDLTISQEKVQNLAGVAVAHVNGFTAELRRLFLVEDFVDSAKFATLLWVMTYIGSWLNGMTLVLLAFISLFTLPKMYENNKESIDTYLDLVLGKITEVSDKVRAALPMSNKKPVAVETDKDK